MPAAADRPLSLVALAVGVAALVAMAVVAARLVREVERERAHAQEEMVRLDERRRREEANRRHAEEDEAVNRSLMELLGGQLRSPLASIRGFARQLQEMGDDLPPGRRDEFFGVIRRQSHRLTRVIEDMMLARRLSTGDAGTDSFVPVDVGSLVADTAADIDSGPAHRLVISVSDELPRIWADPGELRHALLALIENAIRYSPAGGVIEVAALAAPGGVEVSVRDEGIGVPADMRERIFDLMVVGGQEGPESGGPGLGLYVVRRVVERCGGTVTVEETPDGGSVFLIALHGMVPAGDAVLTRLPAADRMPS